VARTPEDRAAGAPSPEAGDAADEPVRVPIDGTLDLHAFDPAEVGDLIPEWMEACRAAGLRELRIVHGKGTGALGRSVRAILARSPLVESFRTASEDGGGWGAVLVTLRR